MYTATVSNRSVSVSSYDAAKQTIKNGLLAAANNIRNNPRLYRSPKTRARIAATVERGVTLPKKAGDVTATVAGIAVRIMKG